MLLLFAPSASLSSWRWARIWQMVLVMALSTWAAGCASLPSNGPRTASQAFNVPNQTTLGRLVQRHQAQSKTRSDSAFRLLDGVDAAFTSRLGLAQAAERSLDLQYYAIHADASTEVLLESLRDAARRGVRIRILLDDFNTVGDDAQVLRLAFEPNVEMRLFNPLPGSRGSLFSRVLASAHNMERLQKRMHNKLFIADNAWGITGGRNLGDAYFGSDDKSNFVDLDVLAAGRIVRDMSASFDRYWNDELAYPVAALVDRKELDRLRDSKKAPSPQADLAPETVPSGGVWRTSLPANHATATVLPGATPTAVAAPERTALDLQRVTMTWAPALLLVDKPGKVGPGDDEVNAGDTVVDGLLQLMQQARQDVLIISPYFVPGAPMMKVFGEIRARGVSVRVLTNSLASNDAPAAHAGYRRYRKDLLAMGVQLYEMRADPRSAPGLAGSGASRKGIGSGINLGSGGGGSKSGNANSRASLHSKAVIIDQRLAVIGSMNLDLRSQQKNSEVALLIRSAAIANEATRLVEITFARGAYKLEWSDNQLYWRAPPGAAFKDATSEPEAGARLRLLVEVLSPFAPDEML